MQDWQQRVIDEKRDLDTRLAKLDHFMQAPGFLALDGPVRNLMHEQHDLMGRLSVVLGRRIERFT
jgi:hypothetical protein